MLTFSIGDVLSRTFSVLFKNFVPFMVLTALVYTPLIAMAVLGDYSAIELEEQEAMFMGGATGVAALLLQLIASAAVMYGVIQQLRGQHASMGASMAMGARRLLPVIGSGFFMILCVVGGLFLLVIPGIIALLMLYVTIPVAVVERPGVFAALGRSAELTKGYKGHIFLIFFVLWLLNLGLGWVVGEVQREMPGTVALIVELAVDVFTGALGAVNAAVVYHDLRVVKEGVNVDELVRVFE